MSVNYRKFHRSQKIVNGKFNLAHVPASPEVFYEIPGWPGYKISQYKNVYSEGARKIMKQYQSHRGKPQKHVVLRDLSGKVHKMNVQKLFWKTFYNPRFL